MNGTAIFYFLLALAINIVYDFIIGARFTAMLKFMDEKISVLHSFYVFCIAKFSSMFTPLFTGSMVSKPLACKHYGDIPLRKGLFITLFEQVLDFGVLIILLPFFLLFLSGYFLESYVQIILFVIGVFLVLFLVHYYEKFIEFIWQFKSILPKKLRAFGKKKGINKERTKETFKEIKDYLTNKKLMFRLSPYILIQVLVIPLVLKFTIAILGFKVGYGSSILIYWVATAVGKLSGLPGGFGSTDLTMFGLLVLFEIPAAEAAIIIVLFRIISLAPAIAVGGPLSFYLSGKRFLKRVKRVKEKKEI